MLYLLLGTYVMLCFTSIQQNLLHESILDWILGIMLKPEHVTKHATPFIRKRPVMTPDVTLVPIHTDLYVNVVCELRG
jgi:hypothetical protein